MVYKDNGILSVKGEYQAPKHDIDPELKLQKPWHLIASRYIYYQHFNSWLYKKQETMRYLRLYGEGNQDVNYKSRFFGESTDYNTSESDGERYIRLEDIRKGYGNIDFVNMFSAAPAMKRALRGIMAQQNHAVRVYANDEYSDKEKRKMKYRIQIQMENKNLFDMYNSMFGQNQSSVPSGMEELQLYDALNGFTLAQEVGLQEVLKDTAEKNGDWRYIKDKLAIDFWEIGCSAAIDRVNPATGKVEWRYQDPEDLIMPYSDTDRFEKIWNWGHVVYYTIGDLRECCPELSENEIYALAAKFSNVLGNNSLYSAPLNSVDMWFDGKTPNYNDFIIPVLEYEIKTVDEFYHTEFAKAENNNYWVTEPWQNGGYKKPRYFENGNRQTKIQKLGRWYTGKWVIGTDTVFHYGLKNDQPYDEENQDARPSLHFYLAFEKSPLQSCIPVLDDMEMLFINYQRDKATSRPNNSIALELDSLYNLSFGKKKVHPFDTIRLFQEQGRLLYSLHAPKLPGQSVQFNNVVPFQEIGGGIEKAIRDFVTGISNCYQQLSVLSGMDQYTMNTASSPADLPAEAIKTAVGSTKDSLKPIYAGIVDIQERLSRNTCIVAQNLIVANDNEDYSYYPVLGRATYIAIQQAGERPLTSYKILCTAMATTQEIAEIKAKVFEMAAGGKNGIPALSASDVFFVIDRLNLGMPLEQIRAYINYKERERDRQQQEIAKQAEQVNTERLLQAEQVKSEQERNTEELKSKLKIREAFFSEMFKAIAQQSIDNNWNSEQMKAEALKMGFDYGKYIDEKQAAQPVGQQQAPPIQDMSQMKELV